MKNRTKELDVDFIGEQGNPPTKEEQHAISIFIKQLKEKRNKSNRIKPPLWREVVIFVLAQASACALIEKSNVSL